AMWVSPRSTATLTMSEGAASASKLARLWTCKSANARTTQRRFVRAGESTSDRSDKGLSEEIEMLEGESGTQRDAIQRVLRHVAGHAGHLRQQLVDVAQQRATAGHDHALVDDVRGQLRGCLLQHEANCRNELLERLLAGFH